MSTDEHPTIARSECPHLAALDGGAKSESGACESCGAAKHLRICLDCGHVSCCESLEGHDRDHFQATGHPLIRPHDQDYDFLWCYECHAYLK